MTPYVQSLAHIARGQYDAYKASTEKQDPLKTQISHYWTGLGISFPGVSTPWSAVFISWCIKQAGATSSEFHFSARHAEFVFHAIKNKTNNQGVFRGYPFAELVPEVGDILQNNRSTNKFNYAYAAAHSEYISHSAIIIEKGIDAQGGFIVTVGGNESQSIRTKKVRLDANGKIVPRVASPFICLIKNSK